MKEKGIGKLSDKDKNRLANINWDLDGGKITKPKARFLRICIMLRYLGNGGAMRSILAMDPSTRVAKEIKKAKEKSRMNPEDDQAFKDYLNLAFPETD